MSDASRDGTATHRRRMALLVGLASVGFWALVVSAIALARYDGDIRALLCIGEDAYLPAPFDGIPRASETGYDGQQYAALATDPFLRKLDTPNAFDVPPYRATRILVPLLAWLLALGNPAAAVVAYQLLCWGLALAAVFLVARWLAEEGHSPLWALLLVANAGLAASVLRSTLDAAAICLILAALFAYSRGRFFLTIALATAAVLTREVSYLAVLAASVEELRSRHTSRGVALATIPLVPFFGWQLYLKSVLGTSGVMAGGKFTIPLIGLWGKLRVVFHGSGVSWQEVFVLLAIAVTTVALVLVASRPSAWAPPETTFLAFATLGLLLPRDAYVEAWGYARILIAAPFLAAVIAERQASRGRRWTLRGVTVLYMVVGLFMIRGDLREALAGRNPRSVTPAQAPVAAGRPTSADSASWARPLYVLPVANSRGRAGATWETRLELTNLATTENTVLVELIPAGRGISSFAHTLVTLAAGQQRSWHNALDELFAFSGTGALRMSALAGPIAANGLTSNVARDGVAAPLLPAVGEDVAIHGGERATLQGLAHDPARTAAVRTNLGLLNLSTGPIRVRIQVYDALPDRLGQIEGDLSARSFVQVNDIFARVRAGAVDGGSAVVEALAPHGAFLVYASVIRGPSAPVVYVFPEPGHPAPVPIAR